MSVYPDHPAIAKDHVKRAFWTAKEGKMSEAAAHLAQALWPPKNPEVYPAHKLPYWFRMAAQEAYEDLIAKREEEAVRTLKDVIYPYGIPAHETAIWRHR